MYTIVQLTLCHEMYEGPASPKGVCKMDEFKTECGDDEVKAEYDATKITIMKFGLNEHKKTFITGAESGF